MSTRNKTTRGLPNLLIQEARLARGWTQQEVANRVGTTVVNVSRWERGVTSPNPYFRQKLCALFEKDAEELGLFTMKKGGYSETPPVTSQEEVSSAVSAKELALPSSEMTSQSAEKRNFKQRRAIVAVGLLGLAGGGGLLTRSLFFTQPTHGAQDSTPKGSTPFSSLAKNMIAEDTFQRNDQTFWGIASDELPWEGDANKEKNFSIRNKTAQITSTPTGTNYDAIIGPKIRNGSILFTGSLTLFADTNFGGTLRWQDTNRWYKAYIDGKSLIIQKRMDADNHPQLQSVPFTAVAGLSYTIRFQIVEALLMAKVWLTTDTEPGNWMVTANDAVYKEGLCGLRIRVYSGTTATVTSFQAASLSS